MTADELAQSETIPKICIVGPPAGGGHIAVRYFTPQTGHRSMAVSGGCCLAAAALIPGPSRMASPAACIAVGAAFGEVDVGIENPAGVLEATIEARAGPSRLEVRKAAYRRSTQICCAAMCRCIAHPTHCAARCWRRANEHADRAVPGLGGRPAADLRRSDGGMAQHLPAPVDLGRRARRRTGAAGPGRGRPERMRVVLTQHGRALLYRISSARIRPAASTAAIGGTQRGVTKPGAAPHCAHAPKGKVHQHEDAKRESVGEHEKLLERRQHGGGCNDAPASAVPERRLRAGVHAGRVSCAFRAMPRTAGPA